MSGRGASAAALTEIGAGKNSPFHLFEGYFDTGVVRLTDWNRPVSWGGNTYTQGGHFLGFDGVQETADLQVTEAHVTLSGIDQTIISKVLNESYIDRRLVIYKAFMTSADALVVDPFAIFDGRMDAPTISEEPGTDSGSGSCTVVLTASSHWVDFQRTPGRHTNDAEQQIFFPGDLGLVYAAEAARQLTWGQGSSATQAQLNQLAASIRFNF